MHLREWGKGGGGVRTSNHLMFQREKVKNFFWGGGGAISPGWVEDSSPKIVINLSCNFEKHHGKEDP